MAIVNRILHSSVVDGPGNRAVVFLQGCNFACSYCHNPETIHRCTNCGACVAKCPTGALSVQDGKVCWNEALCCSCDTCIHICPNLASPRTTVMSAQQVMEQILPDVPFIRGITVSGGECSLQRDFVLELFRMAKEHGLSALMDSNGSYDYASDPELMEVCDGVMLDVKAFDTKAHEALTGCGNDMVLENAVYLAKTGKLEEIRTVIVPDVLPNSRTVEKITALLRPYLATRSIRYKIIAYRKFGVRPPYQEQFRSPTAEEMQSYYRIAAGNGFTDIVLI